MEIIYDNNTKSFAVISNLLANVSGIGHGVAHVAGGAAHTLGSAAHGIGHAVAGTVGSGVLGGLVGGAIGGAAGRVAGSAAAGIKRRIKHMDKYSAGYQAMKKKYKRRGTMIGAGVGALAGFSDDYENNRYYAATKSTAPIKKSVTPTAHKVGFKDALGYSQTRYAGIFDDNKSIPIGTIMKKGNPKKYKEVMSHVPKNCLKFNYVKTIYE